MNRSELRKLSLEYRRLSSNLLNSTDETADINLARFYKLIVGNKLISEIILEKTAEVNYDFKVCFDFEDSGWAQFYPPEDEASHIKAMFDYLCYIVNGDKVNVRSQALRYYCSSRKIDDHIQYFLDKAFKPFIDFINDQISMEMIVLDEEARGHMGNTYIQNIETVNGAANQQNDGVINNYCVTNDMASLLELIDKLIMSLSVAQGIEPNEVENVRDDLEIVQEQLKSESPKKNRIGKALAGIKKFASEFSMKLAVNLATGAVTSTDWSMLIQQLESLIK